MLKNKTKEQLINEIENLHKRIELIETLNQERTKINGNNSNYLNFLENMQRIDNVIRAETDLDKVMHDTLDEVLSIFSCDRAWLLFPCDPDAKFWTIPMECTIPDYPGAFKLNESLPMNSGISKNLKAILESKIPLSYEFNSELIKSSNLYEKFSVK